MKTTGPERQPEGRKGFLKNISRPFVFKKPALRALCRQFRVYYVLTDPKHILLFRLLCQDIGAGNDFQLERKYGRITAWNRDELDDLALRMGMGDDAALKRKHPKKASLIQGIMLRAAYLESENPNNETRIWSDDDVQAFIQQVNDRYQELAESMKSERSLEESRVTTRFATQSLDESRVANRFATHTLAFDTKMAKSLDAMDDQLNKDVDRLLCQEVDIVTMQTSELRAFTLTCIRQQKASLTAQRESLRKSRDILEECKDRTEVFAFRTTRNIQYYEKLGKIASIKEESP